MNRRRSATERGFEAWREAMRWQRSLDKVLRPLGLTHTRYLVLESAAELFDKHDDAIAQREIAEHAGLDEATTSGLVRRLEEDGLLSRDIDGVDARCWRVLVTGRGEATLVRARRLVDSVSERFFNEATS